MAQTTFKGPVTITNGPLTVGGVEISTTEIAYVDGITPGTAAASKAVVLDASKKIDVLDPTSLKINGTTVTSTAAELNILDGVTSTAAELNILDGATVTAAELNAVADVSANGSVIKTQSLALTAATHGTGSEVNTSIVLPAKCVILDIFVDVTAAEVTGATKTIDVGTNVSGSDDPNGFAAGLSVASTGIKRPGATITSGLNEDFFASTTRGALLASLTAGSDSAGDVGTYLEFPAVAEGGATVSITSAVAFTEFAGKLVIQYIEIA